MIIISKEERKNKDVKILKKEDNKKFFKSKDNAKGITLIALVITIIVLLILAGVTISMLTGENGILTKANSAQTGNTVGKEKEEVGLAYSYAKAEKLQNSDTGSVTKENLEDGFSKNDVTVVTVTKESDKLKVTFSDSKNVYEVDNSGNITGPTTGEKPSDNKPYLPAGATVIESDVNKGYTIKDSNNNEWVWVEVPKAIYTNTAYNGGVAPTGETDYSKIESTMQIYAGAYRESWYKDIWEVEPQHEFYDAHGFYDIAAYNNHKNTMLSSVYTNGGFYIGRYEVGTEKQRKSKDDAFSTAVIKQDMYPYNWVTCSESQTLAESLKTGGKTSSLMFGIQWDLVCKYMEEKGIYLGETPSERQPKIKEDSSTWGNYYNVTFEITRGKYSTDNGANFNTVESSYTKPVYTEILLTTGASERNKVLNIYDFAGNDFEFTLERSAYAEFPCGCRGSYYGGGRQSVVQQMITVVLVLLIILVVVATSSLYAQLYGRTECC